MDNLNEHMKEAINYMQGRINAVDNKASIIIALQAGQFGIITFVVEKLYLPCDDLKIISYIFLGLIGLFTAVVIGFLLQTIRPTKNFFSGVSGMEELESPGIIWPNMRCQPMLANFTAKLDSWQASDIEKDLRVTVFACQYLTFNKYRFYRTALRLAKFHLVITFVLVFIIPVWRYV